jgi:transposase-like protein
MPRPYSNDLRARVIESIEAGASRREAADRYELSPSVVVLWAQRWEQTASVAARPSGGSTSPIADHAELLRRVQSFFKADVPSTEEPPHRAAAARNTSFGLNDLIARKWPEGVNSNEAIGELVMPSRG